MILAFWVDVFLLILFCGGPGGREIQHFVTITWVGVAWTRSSWPVLMLLLNLNKTQNLKIIIIIIIIALISVFGIWFYNLKTRIYLFFFRCIHSMSYSIFAVDLAVSPIKYRYLITILRCRNLEVTSNMDFVSL